MESQEPKERDLFALAPPAAAKATPEPNFDTAREVRPVVFGHTGGKDFRPIESRPQEEAPKGSLAPASVSTSESVIGLEDLSADDLETSVPKTVEKETKEIPSETGSSISSRVDSIGKSEPPVVT